jgi:hypothetical protein
MPLGQKLVLLGVDLHLFRVVVLVGMARVWIKGEFSEWNWIPLDKVLLWWGVVTVVFGTLAKPSLGLFINRVGLVYDALACYWFIRSVVRSFDDIVLGVRTLAILTLPVVGLMLVERFTMHNPLAVFGGVPEIPLLRDGEVRCFGSFRQPILAGTFGATQIPLFVGLWAIRPSDRMLAVVAVLASLVIVVLSHSSGPLMACAAVFGGLMLWNWRTYLTHIRWLLVGMIVVLAVVMKAPVWYLFARLGSLTGGGGWHRAYLIDQTLLHFDEWWLFGTTYTAHWGPAGEVIAADPNMMDITNHFIMEGVKGGLLKLILFVAAIVLGFRMVGRWIWSRPVSDPTRFLAWTLGVSLFAHCLSFTSVPYFDQIIVVWYWLLAAIACVGGLYPQPAPKKAEADSEGRTISAVESAWVSDNASDSR